MKHITTVCGRNVEHLCLKHSEHCVLKNSYPITVKKTSQVYRFNTLRQDATTRCNGKIIIKFKKKNKLHPTTWHEQTEGQKRYSSTLSLTPQRDKDGWWTPRPGPFTPPGERYGTQCKGSWLGPRAGLQDCRKSRHPPPLGIWSPDRPACSHSLYIILHYYIILCHTILPYILEYNMYVYNMYVLLITLTTLALRSQHSFG